MTSIALTNDNNCQNQGKGCSTPTPTRLVGIFQRAFEEQVKKKVKRKLAIAAIPASKIPPVLPSSPSEREKEAQTNKERNHFLCRCADKRTESYGEFRPGTFRRFDYTIWLCAFTFSLLLWRAIMKYRRYRRPATPPPPLLLLDITSLSLCRTACLFIRTVIYSRVHTTRTFCKLCTTNTWHIYMTHLRARQRYYC